jgi:[FeFe] hydrogenase H-cluster maturation GTPase HydF
MELLPLGPVLFVDTAGVDDDGALGELRMQRTRGILDRIDLGVVVTEAGAWGAFEDGLIAELRRRRVPIVVAVNKIDVQPLQDDERARLEHVGDELVALSTVTRDGLGAMRDALFRLAPADFLDSRRLIADLVPPGAVAVLVIPIDTEAPKGRLILPQVMAIRDLLDGESLALVAQARGLRTALERLSSPPAIVVTDSQAFLEVAADVPADVPMTSFSILMARFQGDLAEQVRGTLAIERLKEHDRVLIAETCTHHPSGDDIGRVKIPRWLAQYVGAQLDFGHVQGRDFPADPTPYRLVVHCGNCTGNRREMLSRIHRCREAGVPITNYGLTIAYSLGIFERALAPFPSALEAYRAARP